MASWSENSSYQGAASGVAMGAMVGGPVGAGIGGAAGFVVGGLLGGMSEDSARRAEEQRQKEIQKAIERQNTNDFHAKAAAEQWAMSDLGINKEDQVLDARANEQGLQKDVTKNSAKEAKLEKKLKVAEASDFFLNKMVAPKYAKQLRDAKFNTDMSETALANNQGIIANYDASMGAPKKY